MWSRARAPAFVYTGDCKSSIVDGLSQTFKWRRFKNFFGQGLFNAEFLPNRRKMCQQRVYSYLWLLRKNLIRRLAVFASKVTNVDAACYSWKKLNKPSEHYFLKRKHLKNHWKLIKPIWIQMQQENCSYRLRSQLRRSTSKFSIDREMNL